MLHTSSITQIVFCFFYILEVSNVIKKKTREREKQILVFYACEF